MRLISLIVALFISAQCMAIDSERYSEELLSPVVRVSDQFMPGWGSGTILYSKKHNEGYRTFILTNFHVIDKMIVTGKDGKERRKLAVIRGFNYENGRNINSWETKAYIVTYNKTLDLALLEVTDRSLHFKTATILPLGKSGNLKLFKEVWNVGYPTPRIPMFTEGRITGFGIKMWSGPVGTFGDYLRTSSPIFFGNSGGCTFFELDGKFYLVGIPTRIQNSKVPYINYCINLTTIRKFLKEKNLGFVEFQNLDIPESVKPTEIWRPEMIIRLKIPGIK